jgi:ferredoxin
LLEVDKEKCIGCGHCEAIAPNTFEMADGKSQVKNAEGDPRELVDKAIEECPVNAITK